MKNIRQMHLYLGVLFAPFMIYFALSGAWQVFRLHDIPRDATPTMSQKILHALSGPHRDAVFPGGDPKTQESDLFEAFSLLMAVGFIITTVLGIRMALQLSTRRKAVLITLAVGAILPVLLLLVHE